MNTLVQHRTERLAAGSTVWAERTGSGRAAVLRLPEGPDGSRVMTPSRIGYPTAVKPERNPRRKMDGSDGFAGEVLSGEDHQVGGSAVGVVNKGHDISVVLGSIW